MTKTPQASAVAQQSDDAMVMNTEKPMKYREIMWAERQVDFYAGEKCDREDPTWVTSEQNSRGCETQKGPLELDPGTFPPGTKLTVSVPICPKCEMDCELCAEDDDCDFDWEEWAAVEYS